ncbi:Uncharacterised protein [Schaalia odontolytica]|uniref:Uncharacterized protein n=1 Tax=Schaalia odontolytica TaxID=1660 RepID=A0A6N2SQA4_9ACTO
MPCLIACVFCRLRVESGGEALDKLRHFSTSCDKRALFGWGNEENRGLVTSNVCLLKLSCVKASYTCTAAPLFARTSTKFV